MLRSKCYREDYPIFECVAYDTQMFVRRCFRYVLEDSVPAKVFQWFDLPLYDGKLMVERRAPRVDVVEPYDVVESDEVEAEGWQRLLGI